MSKKRIPLLLALIGFLFILNQKANCETVSDQKKPVFFSLYGEGGWALSSFHSSNENLNPQFSSISNFGLGAGVNMRFCKKANDKRYAEDGLFAVQAGLLYTQSGFKVDEEKITGNYIGVPIYFQYYPKLYTPKKHQNSVGSPYVELGAEIWMNVGLSPSNAVFQGFNIDLDKHKANDFKIGIGAGYMHKFEKFGPIGISVKYLIGTSDFAENLPWKGNQLRLTVFYRFGL